jgi:hypothetical protein
VDVKNPELHHSDRDSSDQDEDQDH